MGTLSFITPKDYESPEDNNTDNIYELTIDVSDGNVSASLNVNLTIEDIDDTAPIITLLGDSNITHEAGSVYTDAGATWSDSVDGNGTADTNGTVDQNTPGTYQIIYSFTDSSGNQAQSVTRTVKVENLTSNQNPVFQSDGNIELVENTTFVYDFNATDPNGDNLIYSIEHGADEHFFDLNSTSGELLFLLPKDYENPEDNNSDNIYEISITVSDGNQIVPLSLHIQITDEQFEPNFDTFGPLQIKENRPIGSFVGQFNALNIEPFESFSYSVIPFDENPLHIQDRIMELKALSLDVIKSQEEIDAYQVEIIELQERIELAKSNGLFFVDQNGSLRTNQMLDYEAFSGHPYFTILVQATDKNNFTITKQFMVDLLEVELEPENTLPAIVRTIKPTDNSETRYLLKGEILADGGSVIVETGFWVSKSIRFSDPIRLTALIDPQTGLFHAEFVEFEPGTRYYYRGFAVNNYGESKGSIKKFKTPEIVDPFAWWRDTEEVGGGWRNSDWFGTFLIYPSLDWIFHSKLGWVYTVSDGSEGIWLWHSQHGWLWTQEGVWPFLYSNNSSNWIYFMKNINGQAIFYDYRTNRYLLDIGAVPNI